MTRRFQRNKEDFTCAVCQSENTGNGYTNHCCNCLWSKHVDNNPGDRAAECHGLMEPLALTIKHGEKSIVHRCTVCRIERRCKVAKDDSSDALYKLPLR